MALNEYQCVGFFSSPTYNVGGSLTVYHQNSDWNSAATSFSALLDVIRACQTDLWRWDFSRVSDQGILGDALQTVFGTSKPGTIVSATHPDAGPYDALLIRKVGSIVLNHGFWYLHGIPSDIFTGRAYTGGAAGYYASLFATLDTEVGGETWSWAHRTNPGATPPTYTYTLFDEVLAIKRVQHKIGRPFDDIRGRRRIG